MITERMQQLAGVSLQESQRLRWLSDRQKRQAAKFAKKHDGKSFQAPMPPENRVEKFVVVSPSLRSPYKWRVTLFSNQLDLPTEAQGHSDYKTYEEAVAQAMRYNANLRKAEFS